MSYALREGVTFCTAGKRHFFLDRSANRYFGLSASDEQRFCALRAMDAQARADVPLSYALAQILCAGGNAQLIPFTPESLPRRGMEHLAPVRPRLTLVCRAAIAYLLVKRALRRRATSEILKALESGRRAKGTAMPDDRMLGELGAAFRRVQVWTSQDQCLPLSLACARMADAMGYRVTIVFGITPRPFGAHCWVQAGDHVINDDLARVEAFTQIYAQ